jgi:DNA-binding response OmpR family regulator
MLRMLLSARLRADGYDVVEAADGHEALLTAGRESPDLIVLDRRMPGLDGFAVMRVLREKMRTRTIPVVMVTGLADEQDVDEGLELGVSEYLTKPFNLADLSACVRRLLAPS